MSDLMLLGVLRMPIDPNSGPVALTQFFARAREAADRIESDAAEIERLRAALAQPPAPNPWREAIDTALITSGLDCLGPQDQPTEAVQRLIEWEHKLALDPTISAEAAALLNQKPPAPTAQQCPCKDRPADQCPGEWEPGCDLGANPVHALGGRPVQQPTPCFCDQNNIGAPGVSCGDCPTRDYAQPADTIDCKSVQKRLAVQQPGADVHWCATWLRNNYQDHPSISGLCDAMKEATNHAAPAQRHPLPFETLVRLMPQYPPTGEALLDAFRAAERECAAAWGVTLAAQKGEKL